MLKGGMGFFVICVLTGLLLQPVTVYAQREKGRTRTERHESRMVAPPRNRERMVVGGREYYYSRGVFYRSGPRGYVTIRAPFGARVRALPRGFVTVRIGGRAFFLFGGTYYNYDPGARVYVVVQPPAEAPPPPPTQFDRINFLDGHVLEGTFIGGTDTTIQMEVNGQVQDIPINAVNSVTFAPPAKE